MPLPRNISGEATRTAGLDQTGFYSAGDYVVPEFTESGKKTTPGQVVGNAPSIVELAQRMAAHAEMGGATLLPVPPAAEALKKKATRSSPSRKAPSAPVANQATKTPILRADGLDPNVVTGDLTVPLPVVNTILQPSPSPSLRVQTNVPSSSIEVVFSTQLGRIKVNASAVLDSQNALVLVFAHEGEIRYEPVPGTNVQLIIDGKLVNTMYPGFKFPWMDETMQLMVFVKLPDDE